MQWEMGLVSVSREVRRVLKILRTTNIGISLTVHVSISYVQFTWSLVLIISYHKLYIDVQLLSCWVRWGNVGVWTVFKAGADQFSSDRRDAEFPRGGGGALVRYQGADWTLFIFCHCCQLWFSCFTHQIMTYSITLGLLTKVFFSIKLIIILTYSTHSVFEFFLGGGARKLWEGAHPPAPPQV